MKNSAVQIISLVFGTVLAVTAQDLSPALVGVKPAVRVTDENGTLKFKQLA